MAAEGRPDTLKLSTELAAKALERAKVDVAGNDGSHDAFHLERVVRLAQVLAREESFEDLELVEIAAAMHDLKDYKYSGSEEAGPAEARRFLLEHGMPESRADAVAQVIAHVGFKGEIGREGGPALPEDVLAVLAIVQDADRLDAIGAIGIGRTFTYGGAKNRPMHNPAVPARVLRSKEEYVSSGARGAHENPTLNHFAEKLLLLKDRMKTRSGRARAERRHAFMETFLAEFLAEWDGSA